MVIDDVEALKVISDPLRIRILEHASADTSKAFTAKELAAALGSSQTKLYHHLKLLEEHGFLRVSGTRMVSGIQERRYVATAHTYRVDRSLIAGAGGEAAISHVVDLLFDRTRAEITAAVHAGLVDMEADDPERRRMVLSMTQARLSSASARKVMRQIERLTRIDATEDADGARYGLLIGFYPRATGDER
jgi:DNA-binding transcriptional ArsR family regulator